MSPLEYVRLSKKAEKLGFGCIWLQEGSGWGAIPLAAAILSNTERIKVGTGIVSPFRRHPQVLAEDAAALSELSGGRFVLGVGSGPSQLKALGLKVSQLTGLRESIEIMRRLLLGERFVYPGKIFRIEISSELDVAPKFVPPIYVGALMPKMIQMAAESGDGLLISRRGGSSPRYVAEVVTQVKKVRNRMSKSGPFTVCSFVESSIDDDREKAVRVARQFLTSYTLRLMPHGVLEKTEFSQEEVRPILESGSLVSLDERLAHGFSMSGNPNDCLEKLESFEGTGLDTPILYIHGPSHERALDLAGTQILPKVS
jgi:5,10-methylenetetrahydromethanopterin reductase